MTAHPTVMDSSDLPARDVRLKAIPSTVMNVLFDVQNDLRKKAGRHVSMEKAFCRLVREYKELKQKEANESI